MLLPGSGRHTWDAGCASRRQLLPARANCGSLCFLQASVKGMSVTRQLIDSQLYETDDTRRNKPARKMHARVCWKNGNAQTAWPSACPRGLLGVRWGHARRSSSNVLAGAPLLPGPAQISWPSASTRDVSSRGSGCDCVLVIRQHDQLGIENRNIPQRRSTVLPLAWVLSSTVYAGHCLGSSLNRRAFFVVMCLSHAGTQLGR